MTTKKEVDLKLDLDIQKLKASVNKAERSLDNFSKNIKRSLFRTRKEFADLSSGFKAIGVAAGIAAAGGLYAFNSALRESVELANVQEEAEMKLAGVLRATGEAAGLSLNDLKAYASHLQSITTVGDEVTLAGMSILATFKQIKGDQFKEATKAAIDMSAVMDKDLKSSIIQVGKALNDPIKGLGALSKVGVTFTESQKEQIKVLQNAGDRIGAQKIILAELKSEFGSVADALRGSFKGTAKTLGNTFGDLQEEIGFTITKNSFFIESLKLAEESMANWSKSMKENRTDLLDLSKALGIGLVSSISVANEAVRAFYNAWKGLVLVAHGAVVAINEGLLSIVQSTRAVMFKFDLLFKALEAVNAIDQNPFDSILEGLNGFGEVSKDEFSKILDDVDKMNLAFDNISNSVNSFKKELEGLEAKEVDPAAELVKSTEKAKQEIVKIGDTWVNVNEQSSKASKQSTDKQISELDRFADEAGKTWREYKEEGEKPIKELFDELQALRKEIEKPYTVTVQRSGSSSDGATGYATGGQVYGPGGIDRVPAWLTRGEFVIKKQAVDKFGHGIFHALNSMRMPEIPRFAAGGPVAVSSNNQSRGTNDSVTVNFSFPGVSNSPKGTFSKRDAEAMLREVARMGAMAS